MVSNFVGQKKPGKIWPSPIDSLGLIVSDRASPIFFGLARFGKLNKNQFFTLLIQLSFQVPSPSLFFVFGFLKKFLEQPSSSSPSQFLPMLP